MTVPLFCLECSRPRGCPECAGLGRVYAGTNVFACTHCSGTGDADAYRLLRAYRTGLSDGVEAQRNAMPIYTRDMGLEEIREMVDSAEA